MGRIGLLMLVIIFSAGCNLTYHTEGAVALTDATSLTAVVTPRATRTPISFGITALPTLLPLPGNGGSIINTPQPTLIPVTSAPPLGSICQVYTAYSGVDPQNKLSLRTSASISAPQVFRVPTNAQVLLVPASQEVEGDGYHWLNVIYVDSSQIRYQGWMARDSFTTNGVRDPSIATLRPTGSQAAC